MDRVVSQLLAELDGLSGSSDGFSPSSSKDRPIFVIGATNRSGKHSEFPNFLSKKQQN